MLQRKIPISNNKNNLFIKTDLNSSKHSRENSQKISHVSLNSTYLNTSNTYANTETYSNNKQIPNTERIENPPSNDKAKKIYIYKKNIIKNRNLICKSPTTSRNRNFYSDSKNLNIINNNEINKYYSNNTTNSGLIRSSSSSNFNKSNNIHKVSKFKVYDDNINKVENKIKTFINIEDLLLLEEKFTDIIGALNSKSLNLSNECFEFLNFYNNSSLYDKFENYYKEPESKKLIHESIILFFFNIILTYHISFDKNFFFNCLDIIKILIDFNHKSYLILCEYIFSKVSSSQRDNIWVIKLKNMLNLKLNHRNLNNNDFIQYLSIRENNNYLMSIKEIGFYSYKISNYIRVILRNNQNDNLNSDFIKFFKNINSIKIDEINNFFRKKIIRVLNKNASIMGSDINPLESSNLINVPYIEKKSSKEFTLVLDLDETLISFQTDPYEETKGLLRVRPYLYEFLDKVIQYYELIIFTSATKDYADRLIDEIENNKKNYFDYRLYRHHTIVYNNDFVKDISRIGRDLKKTIIVDNMPQNFRLQKENGIFIKAFWGEDIYDSALLNLGEILEKIAKNYSDVTKGILDFKDEILNKVSSNFSRNSNNVYN
jgi:CTD small phosphatase-like protein 2